MPVSTTWSHHNPVRVVCAALDALGQHVHGQHVLLITTSGSVRRGLVDRVRQILAPRQVIVWDGVKPNPDLQDLDAATALLRPQEIDCVVGLGGGSALDAAKVLATTLSSPPEQTLIQVFRNKAPNHWASRLPLVAVPTTAGTGAEVTPFATVWDHDEHEKHSLAGDFVYPDVALLDVTLTLTLGEEDTLYPALDAISHALESLWNRNSTPISRAFAFQALSLWNLALPAVLKDPQNIAMRQDLQTASVLAGLAISQTKTAIAHAISYPLTSEFKVPHGLACSFTLIEIIDNYLPAEIRESKNLYDEISKVREVLNSLHLGNRVIRYTGRSLLDAPTVCNNLDRLKNFIVEGVSVEKIIHDSLVHATVPTEIE